MVVREKTRSVITRIYEFRGGDLIISLLLRTPILPRTVARHRMLHEVRGRRGSVEATLAKTGEEYIAEDELREVAHPYWEAYSDVAEAALRLDAKEVRRTAAPLLRRIVRREHLVAVREEVT